MVGVSHIIRLSVLNAFFSSAVLGFLPVELSTNGGFPGPGSSHIVNTAPSRTHFRATGSVSYKRWLISFLQNSKDENDQDVFPRHLIDSLDLAQIIEEVARHTTTRRGYDALLSLVQHNPPKKDRSPEMQLSSSNRRKERFDLTRYTGKPRVSFLSPIAKSLEEVHSEYGLIEEATLLLTSVSNDTNRKGSLSSYNLTYPPLYGEYSSPYDIDSIPQTDDDEWLYLTPEQYTAEHILQAEQVIKKLLQIREWSQQETIQIWTPTLAQMGSTIDEEENILPLVYHDIVGNIVLWK